MNYIFRAILLILITISVLSCSEISEPYWKKHKSVYDPKLKQNRCIDETGNIMDIEPPCLSLTVEGRNALQKKEKNCIDEGGVSEKCKKEAWDWLYSKRPKY